MTSRSTDRAKKARIYREAAALMFNPTQMDCWGCCDVINEVGAGDPLAPTNEAKLFADYFKPTGATRCYWGELWSDGDWNDDKAHACRVLALCFMAAIVERP